MGPDGQNGAPACTGVLFCQIHLSAQKSQNAPKRSLFRVPWVRPKRGKRLLVGSLWPSWLQLLKMLPVALNKRTPSVTQWPKNELRIPKNALHRVPFQLKCEQKDPIEDGWPGIVRTHPRKNAIAAPCIFHFAGDPSTGRVPGLAPSEFLYICFSKMSV